MRILIVGDSVAIGVGAENSRSTLLHQLVEDFADAEVVQVARKGARATDLSRMLRDVNAVPRFDLALLQFGGNDVLRLTTKRTLTLALSRVVMEAQRMAERVILTNCANLGHLPNLRKPLTNWLESRSRLVRDVFASVSSSWDILFIDFFRDDPHELFSENVSEYFAEDGIHPSDKGYRLAYSVLRPHLRAVHAATPKPNSRDAPTSRSAVCSPRAECVAQISRGTTDLVTQANG